MFSVSHLKTVCKTKMHTQPNEVIPMACCRSVKKQCKTQTIPWLILVRSSVWEACPLRQKYNKYNGWLRCASHDIPILKHGVVACTKSDTHSSINVIHLKLIMKHSK